MQSTHDSPTSTYVQKYFYYYRWKALWQTQCVLLQTNQLLTNRFRQTNTHLTKCFWPTVLDNPTCWRTYTVLHIMDSVRWRRRRLTGSICELRLSRTFGRDGAGRTKSKRFAAIAPTDGRREIIHCRRRRYTRQLFALRGRLVRRARSLARSPPRERFQFNFLENSFAVRRYDRARDCRKNLYGVIHRPCMSVPICIHYCKRVYLNILIL